MNPLIGALVLVLLGLLGARLSFTVKRAPLGPRLIVAAGTHFLFLGFLLGSHVLDLLNRGTINQLYPFLALGLGWIGLLFGLQLDRRQLRHFPRSYLVVALGQAVVAILLFYAVGRLLALGALRAGPLADSLLLATAATACISTPAGIVLISTTFLVRGKVSQLLLFIASLDGIVGIIALQLAYGLYHPLAYSTAGGAIDGLAWFAVAIALGIVFGIFFLWLTRPKPEREELTLFLLGLVVFAAGTAFYLGLSPLFLSMVIGAIVANFSPLRRQVYAVLQAWEQPIYVILLILAGALLNFPTWVVLPLAAAYLLLRVTGKLVGGYLATHAVRLPFDAPARLGLGLIPQGGISLAMAISVTLTYGTLQANGAEVVEALFATVVLGVVASELIGPLWTRNLLRRAGEVLPKVESALADGGGEIPREQPGEPLPGSRDFTGSGREGSPR
ncbi:MAG TPA: cation:proton antiporter [Longimicrobiales bacterium]